jgi:Lipase (class 3)
MIMARMGLEDNQCVEISQSVDAMGIDSNAFLVQSSDGSVVILSYRGTEPSDVIDWLAITDVSSDRVQLRLGVNDKPVDVHAGFYRNVRATRYKILQALQYADSNDPAESILNIADSHSAGDGTSKPTEASTGLSPAEALYITGHSLGGAMAVLMTVMMLRDSEFKPLADKIKAVYTFGQPMIGSSDFTTKAAGMDRLPSLFRYVYRGDLVPQLPPKESGNFQHFGREFRYEPAENPPWKESSRSTAQTDLTGIGCALFGFFSEKIANLGGLRFAVSIVDHYPQRYISWLTPSGSPTEFGDTSIGVVPETKAEGEALDPEDVIATLLSGAKKTVNKEMDAAIDKAIDKAIKEVQDIPLQIVGTSINAVGKAVGIPLEVILRTADGAREELGKWDILNIPARAAEDAREALNDGVEGTVEAVRQIPIVRRFFR